MRVLCLVSCVFVDVRAYTCVRVRVLVPCVYFRACACASAVHLFSCVRTCVLYRRAPEVTHLAAAAAPQILEALRESFDP